MRARQPADLVVMYEGVRLREERRAERLAWVMTNLINACGQNLERPADYWDLLAGLIGEEAAYAKRRASILAKRAGSQRRRMG